MATATEIRGKCGLLSFRNRAALTAPLARYWARFALDALQRFGPFWSVAPGAAFDPSPRDTEWTRLAILAAQNQTSSLIAHCWRTWYFGALLSEIGAVPPVDQETLLVAAMLHDLGLGRPTPGRCFTLAGADEALATAKRAGVSEGRADAAADAILEHIEVAPPIAPVSLCLQAGSLLDVAGFRMAKLEAACVRSAYRTWPREGFAGELRETWLAECRSVPTGRAAYAHCPGGLLLAASLHHRLLDVGA